MSYYATKYLIDKINGKPNPGGCMIIILILGVIGISIWLF
jgi:hypothetical protein